MALQIELLETSFQAIASCGEAFVTAFYERLFTRFPHTRAFFASTDMKEQRKKLLGALALVIHHLRQPEVLTSALTGLGQRHVTYGVRPEHYPIVGAVLLETFADFLGECWTQAYHDAWAQAYEAVCAIMLERPTDRPQPEQARTPDSGGRATGMSAPASRETVERRKVDLVTVSNISGEQRYEGDTCYRII